LFVKIERSLISSIPTMSKKFEWLVQSKIKLLYKKRMVDMFCKSHNSGWKNVKNH
jgi:hypothetical protein